VVHGSRSMTAASSAAVDSRGAPSLPDNYVVRVKRTFPGSPDQVAHVVSSSGSSSARCPWWTKLCCLPPSWPPTQSSIRHPAKAEPSTSP